MTEPETFQICAYSLEKYKITYLDLLHWLQEYLVYSSEPPRVGDKKGHGKNRVERR